MPLTPDAQWRGDDITCPWRLQRGTTLYACDHGGGDHDIHVTGHPIMASWRADDVGAFSVIGSSEPTLDRPTSVRVARIRECANRQCPNKASEGEMTLTTIHTALRGAPRDVALLLCAPCSEYVTRMFTGR